MGARGGCARWRIRGRGRKGSTKWTPGPNVSAPDYVGPIPPGWTPQDPEVIKAKFELERARLEARRAEADARAAELELETARVVIAKRQAESGIEASPEANVGLTEGGGARSWRVRAGEPEGPNRFAGKRKARCIGLPLDVMLSCRLVLP